MSDFKPSQLISRDNIDVAYDDLAAINRAITKSLSGVLGELSEANNTIKELRRENSLEIATAYDCAYRAAYNQAIKDAVEAVENADANCDDSGSGAISSAADNVERLAMKELTTK